MRANGTMIRDTGTVMRGLSWVTLTKETLRMERHMGRGCLLGLTGMSMMVNGLMGASKAMAYGKARRVIHI